MDTTKSQFFYIIYFWIIFVFNIARVFCGNSRSYVTENCGHVIGPDYGAFIEFDRHAKRKGKITVPPHLKGTILECMLVIRGMPSMGSTKRYMAMHWKEFHVRDQSVDTIHTTPEDCKKAYVSIYGGMDRTAPLLGTFCGKDILMRNFEVEGEYIALLFYADYSNPNLIQTEPTDNPKNSVVTTNPNNSAVTGVTKRKNVKTTTPPDIYPYPLIYIRLDITSFDYDCEDTVQGVSMKCNDSQRCLDDSLRCDYWYSKNCASPVFPLDKSDSGRFYPALCFVIPTTTTEAPSTTPAPPIPFDWTPVYAAVSGAAGFIVMLWCCCSPGYLPWRCSRIRNARCLNLCRSVFPCCKRHNSPCCSRFCPSCYGGYGPNPTGSAMERLRQKRLLDGSSNASPNGSQFSGESDHKPNLKSKIFPCLSGGNQSGWPGRRIGAVAPMDRTESQSTPFPYDRIHSRFPFGKKKPQNSVSPFDMRDDPEGLGTGWINLILHDGGHLREQR